VPQNAGERRYPAAGGRCDRVDVKTIYKYFPAAVRRSKIHCLFLICYIWLNQFIQF
jgi:hypothetical protein